MVSIDTHLPRGEAWTKRSPARNERRRLRRLASVAFGMLIVGGVWSLVALAWVVELARTRRWPARVFPE